MAAEHRFQFTTNFYNKVEVNGGQIFLPDTVKNVLNSNTLVRVIGGNSYGSRVD